MGILGNKTFRGGKETGDWKGDKRGVDEMESRQQVINAPEWQSYGPFYSVGSSG